MLPAFVTVNVTAPGAMLGAPAYAGSQFQFAVTGATNHVIQVSSNLINWLPLQTNRGPFTFVDPAAATFPSRFYRAVSTP